MYSAALQRYYNEHEHLPYTFYAQPKRFTQYAIEKRGELLATAYNYIEPDAKGTRDFVEYSSADELTEQGSFLLCGWNADHTHMVISEVGAETEECVRRTTEELSFPIMIDIKSFKL